MTPASGTAWRRIGGHRPLAPRPPVRRARHRLQQALLLHRPAAAGPGRAAARPRLPARRGAEGRRGRRRRGGRGRGPGRAARGRAAGRRDACARSGWRSAAGGRSRAMCGSTARCTGRGVTRGRPAAPARPRAPRGVHARARGAARGAGRGHASTAAARSGTRAACPGSGSRSWPIWSRCPGPALRNLLACLERCHVEVKGVVSRELRRGDRLPRRGRAGARLPGPRLRRRHHRPRPFRRWPADPGRARSPMAATTSPGDLAYGLSTSRQHAERIKNLFGGTQFRSCDEGTRIEHPRLGDHAELPTGEVPRTRITEIVRARVEEILALARRRLDEHRELLATRPPRSIVLTGGGSQLEGIEELVQEVFRLPARCGRPGALVGARPRGRALLRHGGRCGGPGARRRWRPRLARSDRGLGALAPSCATWPMV